MAERSTPRKPGPNIPNLVLNEAGSQLVQEIEEALSLHFSNKALLLQAFIHNSYSNPEVPIGNNERLEFLGNSVLGLIVRDHLFIYYDLDEGPMTHISSHIESARSLAKVADKLHLTRWLVRPVGAMKLGVCDEKLKCDLVEALIGAMFIDGGGRLESVREFMLEHIFPSDPLDLLSNYKPYGPKVTLRNKVFDAEGIEPKYKVIYKSPGFYSTFVVGVYAKGGELGRGEGPTRKLAETAAAIKALKCYKPPWQID